MQISFLAQNAGKGNITAVQLDLCVIYKALGNQVINVEVGW